MDRVFRLNGHNPQLITALERLAYIGDRCLGALSYEPEIGLLESDSRDVELITLGQEAVKEFEGTESRLIKQLMNAAGYLDKTGNGDGLTHAEEAWQLPTSEWLGGCLARIGTYRAHAVHSGLAVKCRGPPPGTCRTE